MRVYLAYLLIVVGALAVAGCLLDYFNRPPWDANPDTSAMERQWR